MITDDVQGEVSAKLRNLAQCCQDDLGRLDKDMFRVVAMLYLGDLHLKGQAGEAVKKEISACLSRILGHGHSLASCKQVIRGKKARAAMEKLERELRAQPTL